MILKKSEVHFNYKIIIKLYLTYALTYKNMLFTDLIIKGKNVNNPLNISF